MTLPSHPPHSYILCTSCTTHAAHTAIGEPEGASLRQLGGGRREGGGEGGREGGRGGGREEGGGQQGEGF